MIRFIPIIIALTVATGCSSLRYIPGDEFIERADAALRSVGQTLPDEAEFIGITEDRAYLEYRSGITIFGPRTRVYWTSRDELTPLLERKLKGANPLWNLLLIDDPGIGAGESVPRER
jgi:hypothetical protein